MMTMVTMMTMIAMTCSVIGGGAVVVNNQVACCTISTTWPSVLSDQEMMRMKMRRRVRMSMRGVMRILRIIGSSSTWP